MSHQFLFIFNWRISCRKLDQQSISNSRLVLVFRSYWKDTSSCFMSSHKRWWSIMNNVTWKTNRTSQFNAKLLTHADKKRFFLLSSSCFCPGLLTFSSSFPASCSDSLSENLSRSHAFSDISTIYDRRGVNQRSATWRLHLQRGGGPLDINQIVLGGRTAVIAITPALWREPWRDVINVERLKMGQFQPFWQLAEWSFTPVRGLT